MSQDNPDHVPGTVNGIRPHRYPRTAAEAEQMRQLALSAPTRFHDERWESLRSTEPRRLTPEEIGMLIDGLEYAATDLRYRYRTTPDQKIEASVPAPIANQLTDGHYLQRLAASNIMIKPVSGVVPTEGDKVEAIVAFYESWTVEPDPSPMWPAP